MRREIPCLFLLAACGSDPPPEPVDVTGKVFATDDFQVTALEGVTVEWSGGASATTDAEGAFALTIPDRNDLDAYLSIETAGRVPTRVYPPLLEGGEDLLTVVADADELAEWYEAVGESWSASQRTMIVAVTDEELDAIEGATVEVAPAPRALVYYDPDAPGWDPSLTESKNGFALVAGAAGSVTLTSGDLPSRTLPVEAGALTMTVIR